MNLSGRWRCSNRPTTFVWGLVGLATLFAVPCLAEEKKEVSPTANQQQASPAAATEGPVSGGEIFAREWLVKDGRSHGGDGLGPVFNDTSCVACHNQGGIGGGGPNTKNVTIVSAFVQPQHIAQSPGNPSALTQFLRTLAGLPAQPPKDEAKVIEARKQRLIKQLKEELVRVHPGFRSARSVVLHHASSDDSYDAWRSNFSRIGVDFNFAVPVATRVEMRSGGTFEIEQVQTEEAQQQAGEIVQTLEAERQRAAAELQRVRAVAMSASSVSGSTMSHGNVTTTSSQRNPTALFGAGLIDSVPDEALEAQAKVQHANSDITGRVSRLENGKIGRFGWKSQKPTLYDFTVTACGVELGLNVPDHPQSGQPLDPNYQPTGLDLDQQEVDALVGYLKALPAPAQTSPKATQEFVHAGQKAFHSAGCADCHVEKLASVEGIYSDLLLHDMGDDTADTGGYGVFVPTSPGGETGAEFPALTDAFQPSSGGMFMGNGFMAQPASKTLQQRAREIEQTKMIGATRFEWRTPPLWGARDSGPYMHDGRAATLEHAIALHGGEAEKSAQEFFALSPKERQQLVAFLKTLVAPTELAAAN